MSWKKALVAMLPMVLLLGACGGDDEASTDIEATTTDFAFSPTEWSVPAGEEISLDLTNNGDVTHEYVILKDGVQISDESDLPETEEELLSDFVFWEEEIEAGDSKTVTFTAPTEPGTYQVICAIETHFNAGMNARLVVVDPDA